MTQLVSPFLVRGLWGYPSSESHSGDVTSSAIVAKLQAGIARCAAEGKAFIVDELYRITTRAATASSTFFTHTSGAMIEGLTGCGFDMSPCANSGSVRYILRADGTAGSYTNLTADGERDSTTITVGTAGIAALGLAVGDRIHIMSDKLFITGGTVGAEEQGEISTVTGLTTSTIQIEPPLFDDYATTDVARVAKLTMHRGSVRNLILRGPGQFTTDTVGDRGLHYIWSDGLRIEDVESHMLDNGNYLYSCPDLRVKGFKWRFDEQNSRAANQYGLALVNACQDVVIEGCDGINGKHGIVQTESSIAPGVTRRVTIRDNFVRGTFNYGIAMHTNAENIEVARNKLANCNAGLEAGCRNFRSESNVVEMTPNDNLGIGLGINDIADGVVSRNDRFYAGRYGVRLDNDPDILFAGSAGPRKIHVIDAYAERFALAGVEIVNVTSGRPGSDVVISRLQTREAGGAASGVTSAPSISVQGQFTNVVIENGNYQASSGNTSACIVTSGITNGRVRHNDYTGHASPILGGTDVTSHENNAF